MQITLNCIIATQNWQYALVNVWNWTFSCWNRLPANKSKLNWIVCLCWRFSLFVYVCVELYLSLFVLVVFIVFFLCLCFFLFLFLSLLSSLLPLFSVLLFFFSMLCCCFVTVTASYICDNKIFFPLRKIENLSKYEGMKERKWRKQNREEEQNVNNQEKTTRKTKKKNNKTTDRKDKSKEGKDINRYRQDSRSIDNMTGLLR